MEMFLPKTLVDLVYQFNPSHREEMYNSLVEIILKNSCYLCGKTCDQNENCIKPGTVLFCNNSCLQFWLSRNNYLQNYDPANDVDLGDDGLEDELEEYDEYRDFEMVHDYFNRHGILNVEEVEEENEESDIDIE